MSEESGVAVLSARHARLRLALQVSLVLAALNLLYEVAELLGLYTLNADPESDLTLLDSVYLLLATATLVVAIATIILWCFWLHRAARNIVDSDATHFGFTPGWAVGWHFIPIANLFKPFEVMREIWNASVGEMNILNHPEPLVTRWWIAWIISSIAGNISFRIAMQAETAEGLYWSTVTGAVSSVASLIAIPAALTMLAAITEGQRQRF
jgi:hypothetical protein